MDFLHQILNFCQVPYYSHMCSVLRKILGRCYVLGLVRPLMGPNQTQALTCRPKISSQTNRIVVPNVLALRAAYPNLGG